MTRPAAGGGPTPGAPDGSGDRLESMLREVSRVPPEVAGEAKAAFALRHPGARLLQLAMDADATGAARRQLTFGDADLNVELTVTVLGRSRRLTGRVSPTCPVAITALTPTEEVGAVYGWTDGDPSGSCLFTIDGLRPGLMSLFLELEGSDRGALTEWTAI